MAVERVTTVSAGDAMTDTHPESIILAQHDVSPKQAAAQLMILKQSRRDCSVGAGHNAEEKKPRRGAGSTGTG